MGTVRTERTSRADERRYVVGRSRAGDDAEGDRCSIGGPGITDPDDLVVRKLVDVQREAEGERIGVDHGNTTGGRVTIEVPDRGPVEPSVDSRQHRTESRTVR